MKNNVQDHGKILNDWSSAGKTEHIKIWIFSDQTWFTLGIKVKTANIMDLGVLTKPHSVVQHDLQCRSQCAASVCKTIV
jgi:hypothetical protein